MSDLSREDVLQILDLIDKAHYDFFELQSGELKLVVSKTGLPGPSSVAAAPAAGAVTSPAPPPPAPLAAKPAPAPAPAAAPAPARDRTGLVPVTAPMVGTYYAQPEPGAPPYVQVGGHVDEDTTVGLVEVMKVFTAVRAGTTGTVVECLVQNAQFVQYGETLFYIRPDEA